MPRKLSRGTRLRTAVGAAVIAALALPGAAAAAECPTQPSTTAFAAFGDANQYFLAPGGDFESLDAWTRQGRPSLVSGLNVLGITAGARSVDLDNRDGVTSQSFCVDRTMPHLRFTARAAGGGQLDVTVTTSYGGSTDSSGGSISPDDHRSWAPSRYVELKTDSIPVGESGVATVSFRSQGDWKVDDVHVDPYRR